MKSLFQKYLFFHFLTLMGCNGHNLHKIRLDSFNDKREVIYETQDAKFVFRQNDIIEYCKKKDNSEHNNYIYKQVLQYIEKFKNNSIKIPDTLGTELVRDSKYNFKNKSDTLVRERNNQSKYSHVTDAIRWTLIDFIKEGKVKVFDNRTEKFVSYIFLDEVETSNYGETNIHLPNDSIIFSQLRWIR